MSEENKQLEAAPEVLAPEVTLPEGATNFDGKTPEEIEQLMIDQKLKERELIKPEDYAAGLWKIYWPLYKNSVKKLSRRQMSRILQAIVEVPLNKKAFKLMDKDEQTIYAVAMELINAKFQMLAHREMQAVEEAQAKELEMEAAAKAAAEATPVAEESKGETNVGN